MIAGCSARELLEPLLITNIVPEVDVRVAWVTEGGLIKDPSGAWSSDIASARYRILIPAREMLAKGVESQVISVNGGDDLQAREGDFPRNCDVLVISKNFNAGITDWIERFQALGRPVVVDFCDDHFAGEYGDLHRQWAALADGVVANTEVMAQRIEAECGRKAHVIPDPYEGVRQPPRFSPEKGVLRLLWFGSDTQLSTLGDYLPRLLQDLRARGVRHRVHIEMLTKKNEELQQALDNFNREHAPEVILNLTEWHLGGTEKALARCDAVIIPSKNEPRFQVKSANRLLLSLWNGRFAAAWSLPEYRQFAAWSYVGEELAEGLCWALANPLDVTRAVQAAQEYIGTQFSPWRIGKAWLSRLHELQISG